MEMAASDRQAYVEERSKEIDDLEEGLPHCSLMSLKEVPIKAS